MRALVITALTLSALPAWAGTSHPSSWSTGFNNPSGVTTASGYSWDSATYTCGSPGDTIVSQSWSDFSYAPWSIGPKYLDITWQADGYVGHGETYIDIVYTLDGSTWNTAVAQVHTSGGSFSTAKTTTSIPLGRRLAPGMLGSLQVHATLSVLDACSGLVGSYSGRVKVHEISVQL
jgi:hypothetical protein